MLLKLDMSSHVPIYMQIRNQIVLGIASGELAPGEKLPTIRALAEQSGVNMMTVNKAYGLLKQQGYITTDRRGGTVVTGSPGASPFFSPSCTVRSRESAGCNATSPGSFALLPVVLEPTQTISPEESRPSSIAGR